MKKTDIIKGFLIKPIMELIKKDYNIKSPTPINLFVNEKDDNYSVVYKTQKIEIDFSKHKMIIDLIREIKNKDIYEKL